MTNEAAVIRNFAELVRVLTVDGIPSRADAAEQVFSAPIKAPPLDTMVFVRWEKQLPLLHMLCPVIDGITDARLADAEAAVCRANNAALVPGFGIDYGKRAIYFRVSQPVIDGLSRRVLDAQFDAMVNTARDYVTSFHKVVREGMRGEAIADLAEVWVAADRAAHPDTSS